MDWPRKRISKAEAKARPSGIARNEHRTRAAPARPRRATRRCANVRVNCIVSVSLEHAPTAWSTASVLSVRRSAWRTDSGVVEFWFRSAWWLFRDEAFEDDWQLAQVGQLGGARQIAGFCG